MASLKLHGFVFLLCFCFRCGAISLDQPSVLAATVGSTANLNCSLQLGDRSVKRINPYWYSPAANGTLRKYWYPSTMAGSTNTSVWLTNPSDPVDMSLSVANLSLAHTDTFVCFVSLVGDFNKSSLSGKGTFLLVHEPLDTSVNDTDLICRTKVGTVAGLSLLWKMGNGTVMSADKVDNVDNLMSSVIPKDEFLCSLAGTTNLTCVLQYNGTTLVEERIEIPCTGDTNGAIHTGEARQPVLLYSLILGSSLLILIVLLIIWVRIKWMYRANVDSSPYTNISQLKRAQCL